MKPRDLLRPHTPEEQAQEARAGIPPPFGLAALSNSHSLQRVHISVLQCVTSGSFAFDLKPEPGGFHMVFSDSAAVNGLVRDVMALLRRAYDLGRSDALRDAAEMISSEAVLDPELRRDQSAPAVAPRRRPSDRARARGPRGNSILTDEQKAAAEALFARGDISSRQIAIQLGVPTHRIYRWAKERKKKAEL